MVLQFIIVFVITIHILHCLFMDLSSITQPHKYCHFFSLFHMFLLHYFCPRNSQLIGIIRLRSHAIGKKTLSNNIFSLDEMKSFKFLKNNFSSQLSIQLILKNCFKMFKSYSFIGFH